DARLKARLGQAAAAAQPQTAPVSAAPQLAAATPLGAQSAGNWQAEAMQFAPVRPGRKVGGAAMRHKASPPVALLVGGPVAGIVVVAGIFIALNSRQDNAGVADTNIANPQVATVTPPRDK